MSVRNERDRGAMERRGHRGRRESFGLGREALVHEVPGREVPGRERMERSAVRGRSGRFVPGLMESVQVAHGRTVNGQVVRDVREKGRFDHGLKVNVLLVLGARESARFVPGREGMGRNEVNVRSGHFVLGLRVSGQLVRAGKPELRVRDRVRGSLSRRAKMEREKSEVGVAQARNPAANRILARSGSSVIKSLAIRRSLPGSRSSVASRRSVGSRAAGSRAAGSRI